MLTKSLTDFLRSNPARVLCKPGVSAAPRTTSSPLLRSRCGQGVAHSRAPSELKTLQFLSHAFLFSEGAGTDASRTVAARRRSAAVSRAARDQPQHGRTFKPR